MDSATGSLCFTAAILANPRCCRQYFLNAANCVFHSAVWYAGSGRIRGLITLQLRRDLHSLFAGLPVTVPHPYVFLDVPSTPAAEDGAGDGGVGNGDASGVDSSGVDVFLLGFLVHFAGGGLSGR